MPALFGAMSAPAQQSFTPLAGPVEIRKRKNPLFGALSSAGNWLGSESAIPGVNRFETIGATLKDIGGAIDGGPSDNLMNLDIISQRQQQAKAQQAWQAEQQMRQRQEWEGKDSQTAAINNWVSTLPPEQQMLARVNPEAAQKMYLDAQKPKEPEYRSVKGDFIRFDPNNGSTELIYRAPADASGGNQRPKLAEVRQWTNQYNDDSTRIKDGLGNSRAAIPYASAVIANRGQPPAGSNPRLADTQLLRAAARAQTGPGVLTESEVFGTLSPSLQQEIRRQGAYFDASSVVLSPQDRLALAQNVNQGATSAAGDLWRLYDSTKGVLDAYEVPLNEAGILPPDMPHPDDMPALSSPQKQYQPGKQYQGPTGRIYKYKGPGKWEFVRQEAPTYYNQETGGGAGKKRIRLEP